MRYARAETDNMGFEDMRSSGAGNAVPEFERRPSIIGNIMKNSSRYLCFARRKGDTLTTGLLDAEDINSKEVLPSEKENSKEVATSKKENPVADNSAVTESAATEAAPSIRL